MNNVVAAIVLVFAMILGATVWFLGSTRLSPEEQLQPSELSPELSEKLDRIVEQQSAMSRRLDQLERGPGVASSPSPNLQAITDAVADRLANRSPKDISDAKVTGAATESAAAREFDLSAAVQKLSAPDLSAADRRRIMEQVAELGLHDQFIAALEARAQQDPRDPDVQADLGEALINKLTSGGVSQLEVMKLATRADKAYDQALDAESTHWRARFNKAVSLSFWPPITGKQPEAIKNFETLVEQQRQMPASDQHAQTYLLLGNMYLQQGQTEKARATWREGLERFPRDESLKSQLGN
ncbi:MAG: hypothetical protein KDB53_14040 [Planctomycetes bacterium]|nr:hypothetical protein [Planctomycetota bacterium]